MPTSCMQCCIDLQKGVLRVGTTGNETAFLTEMDLQEKEEMERRQAVSCLSVCQSSSSKRVVCPRPPYEGRVHSGVHCTGEGACNVYVRLVRPYSFLVAPL